jgi:hypothetical protein
MIRSHERGQGIDIVTIDCSDEPLEVPVDLTAFTSSQIYTLGYDKHSVSG